MTDSFPLFLCQEHTPIDSSLLTSHRIPTHNPDPWARAGALKLVSPVPLSD